MATAAVGGDPSQRFWVRRLRRHTLQLQRAVELRPQFDKARMLRAQVYLDSRNFAAVKEATDPLLKQGPFDAHEN